MADFWFKPKSFGYGATPVTWQGWASMLGFALLLVVLTMGLIVVPGSAGEPFAWWRLGLWLVATAAGTAWFIRFARARTNGEWRWRP